MNEQANEQLLAAIDRDRCVERGQQRLFPALDGRPLVKVVLPDRRQS